MDLLIEERLSKHKTHIIDYATLKSILLNLNYENINDKINRLKQKGILKSLKKGYYIHTSLINKNIISKEFISNTLLDSPSYISLDYALSFYGLIPEAVHEITAVTSKRSKVFKTGIGIFSYKHIKKELFALGLKMENSKIGNYMIATREKAICDKIFFTKDVELSSKSSMINFLENDLRVDTDEFEDFDIKILSDYYQISRSKKIKLLISILTQI